MKYFSERKANGRSTRCSLNDRDGCQPDVTSGAATQCTYSMLLRRLYKDIKIKSI